MAGTTFSIANQAFAAFRAALNAILNGLYLHGQCRFIYVNSTTCMLIRYNGRYIVINGSVEEIPSGGVSLSVTGLTPSTGYYVYAWMNGSTMTLEASTTGHSKDATTGVEIKTGDPTRTLVGWVNPGAGPVFQDSEAIRFVASWFNRRRIQNKGQLTQNRTTTSLSAVEINTEARVWFFTWGDSATEVSHAGNAAASVIANTAFAFGLDSTTSPSFGAIEASSVAGHTSNLGTSGAFQASEGPHYIAYLGWLSSAGTATYSSGNRINVINDI